jgi:hypothetical protein
MVYAYDLFVDRGFLVGLFLLKYLVGLAWGPNKFVVLGRRKAIAEVRAGICGLSMMGWLVR